MSQKQYNSNQGRLLFIGSEDNGILTDI